MPMPLAQSIGLPPPIAIMTSHSLDRYSSAPAITSSTLGLGEISVKMVQGRAASSSSVSISPTQPASDTPGSDTRKTWRARKLLAELATERREAAPETMSVETNLVGADMSELIVGLIQTAC